MSAASWAAVPAMLAVLAGGIYLSAVLDEILAGTVAGRRPSMAAAVIRPVRRGALLLTQRPSVTERPDALLWVLAPAAYLGLAGLALAVVPLSPGFAVADVRTGIVVFGAAEVLAIVAVHLHGWAPNSALALIGGYRFVAQGLSLLLLSMFVLIAAALPAESLSVGAIVASQAELFNVVRQPLGLPLFLVVGLGIALWGPLDLPEATELAGGTSAESSGPARLAWELGRRAMLVAYAVMGSAVFAGGWLGPWLPGPVWLLAKAAVILVVLLGAGHLFGRVPVERFVTVAWTVLLPVSFLGLALAGIEALP